MTSKVTGASLEEIMADVNGASFVSIDTMTVPALKGGKGNPMQGRVLKRSEGCSVMVFQNKTTNAYENMVNKRLKEEGKDPDSFTLGERAWGTRRKDTPFIEHNGALYLEVIFLKAPKLVEYLLDGKPISKDEIIGLQDDKVDSESQGGLDNKVIVRTFKCESIKRVRVNQKEYVL